MRPGTWKAVSLGPSHDVTDIVILVHDDADQLIMI